MGPAVKSVEEQAKYDPVLARAAPGSWQVAENLQRALRAARRFFVPVTVDGKRPSLQTVETAGMRDEIWAVTAVMERMQAPRLWAAPERVEWAQVVTPKPRMARTEIMVEQARREREVHVHLAYRSQASISPP